MEKLDTIAFHICVNLCWRRWIVSLKEGHFNYEGRIHQRGLIYCKAHCWWNIHRATSLFKNKNKQLKWDLSLQWCIWNEAAYRCRSSRCEWQAASLVKWYERERWGYVELLSGANCIERRTSNNDSTIQKNSTCSNPGLMEMHQLTTTVPFLQRWSTRTQV